MSSGCNVCGTIEMGVLFAPPSHTHTKVYTTTKKKGFYLKNVYGYMSYMHAMNVVDPHIRISMEYPGFVARFLRAKKKDKCEKHDWKLMRVPFLGEDI